MPLTKQDINEIKGAMDGSFSGFEVKMGKRIDDKIDELARTVAKGFEETASKADLKRLDGEVQHIKGEVQHIKGEVQHIKGEVQHINATMGAMATDVADIKKHFVYRDEFEDLMARVKYLETKLGVESGK